MAQKRLAMRKVKKTLAFHFEEGRSARSIATHCGIARRSVMQTLERFAASGLSWPEADDMDDAALESALYPSRPPAPTDGEVDWARVEEDLSRPGVTLKLLWEEWRVSHPAGMSYVTWWRRFQDWRPGRDATMRQRRHPGERLFLDYAGMTVPLLQDGTTHRAQVFTASMGVSGLVYAEATLTQNIDDWCASSIRCFEKMGRVPKVVVPDNVKAAVTKASRYEPVLNEAYADLLEHYGVLGLPARVRKPRDKALVENGVLLACRRVLAPLRDHVFHDLTSLNQAIAGQVREVNRKPYTDGTGENRFGRFESVDAPHMKPLPNQRWQRTVWRQNKVHLDYHITINYRHYSVPYQYIGKKVDVRLRGQVIDVFHQGKQIASHLALASRGRATTTPEHRPKSHQRAGIEATRAQIEKRSREIGPHVHGFVSMVMERSQVPEAGFRTCYGVLRLEKGYGAGRLDNACRHALDIGTTTWRGLDNILRTGTDLADHKQQDETLITHSNIRGPEYFK